MSAGHPDDIYNAEFFADVRGTSATSAGVVVPIVVEWLRPLRVLDVGCGEGAWLAEFRAHGCNVLGVDGPYVDREHLSIPGSSFVSHDLRLSLPASVIEFGADLTVCLEVAEHLPPDRGPGLIDDLVASSDRVLFSAATPGQGGHGHVNEKEHDWWIREFEERGYAVSRILQQRLAAEVAVAFWYRDNVLVARRI